MKAKTMRRLLCVLLSVALLASGMSVAAVDIPTPYYDATASITAGLTISSSGLASCSGSIMLSSSGNSATLTMKLQQYTSSGWTTIGSWSTQTTRLYKNQYVVHGYYYRVVCSANVYSSSGTYIESPSVKSSNEYY